MIQTAMDLIEYMPWQSLMRDESFRFVRFCGKIVAGPRWNTPYIGQTDWQASEFAVVRTS